MKYSDGQIVQIHDKVELWHGCSGVVVCFIDTDEYSPDYLKENWAYLKSGVMIMSEKSGLFQYTEAPEDLRLLERTKVWSGCSLKLRGLAIHTPRLTF